jgi:hypothetical protein
VNGPATATEARAAAAPAVDIESGVIVVGRRWAPVAALTAIPAAGITAYSYLPMLGPAAALAALAAVLRWVHRRDTL